MNDSTSVEPRLANDGYPSDEELLRVRSWPVEDALALMAYVRARWTYDGWSEEDLATGRRRFTLHTYGWSGNEELIAALEGNRDFWGLFWWSSQRGGHYVFHVAALARADGVSPKCARCHRRLLEPHYLGSVPYGRVCVTKVSAASQ